MFSVDVWLDYAFIKWQALIISKQGIFIKSEQ